MGNIRSKEGRSPAKVRSPITSKYRIIFQVQKELLQFDPLQSYALSIGIDKQRNIPSLGLLVANDSTAISEACTTSLEIPASNVDTLLSSKDPELLFTEVGVSSKLVDTARKVGSEGIFIIAFSGHGITTTNKDGVKQSVLALLNHSPHSPECLSAEDLVGLIEKRANFRGKSVLLVLDCCFGGGISRWLSENERSSGRFRTISACSPYQTSIQLDPLGHSVFTYFLLDALTKKKGITGTSEGEPMIKMCLDDIFEVISNSSWALSSIYIKYDHETRSLKGCTMTPELGTTLKRARSMDMLDDGESTDGPEVDEGRLSIIQKYWKDFPSLSSPEGQVIITPQYSYRWLDDQTISEGPLRKLEDEGHLTGPVVQAVLCSLCNSMAAIHLYECHPWNGKGKLFIIDYCKILVMVESVMSPRSVELNHSIIKQALTYFYAVYKNSMERIDLNELRNLYWLLSIDEMYLKNKEEHTDGPQGGRVSYTYVCIQFKQFYITEELYAQVYNFNFQFE